MIVGGLSGRLDQTIHTIHALTQLLDERGNTTWVVGRESLACVLGPVSSARSGDRGWRWRRCCSRRRERGRLSWTRADEGWTSAGQTHAGHFQRVVRRHLCGVADRRGGEGHDPRAQVGHGPDSVSVAALPSADGEHGSVALGRMLTAQLLLSRFIPSHVPNLGRGVRVVVQPPRDRACRGRDGRAGRLDCRGEGKGGVGLFVNTCALLGGVADSREKRAGGDCEAGHESCEAERRAGRGVSLPCAERSGSSQTVHSSTTTPFNCTMSLLAPLRNTFRYLVSPSPSQHARALICCRPRAAAL